MKIKEKKLFKTLLIILCCCCLLLGLEYGGAAFVVKNYLEISHGDEGLVFSQDI